MRTRTTRQPAAGDRAEPSERASPGGERERGPAAGGVDLATLVVEATAGGGAPLPADVRNELEARLGADFADVRVHTGPRAAAAARRLAAGAFTVGSDIVFAGSGYDPYGKDGRLLLAHELAHVRQQRTAPSRDWRVGPHDDALEAAAEATARSALASPRPVVRPARPSAVGRSSSRLVQRRAVLDAAPDTAAPSGTAAPRAPSPSAEASPWLGTTSPGMLDFRGGTPRLTGTEPAAGADGAAEREPLDPTAEPPAPAPPVPAAQPPPPEPATVDPAAAAARTDQAARAATDEAARADAGRSRVPAPGPAGGAPAHEGAQPAAAAGAVAGAAPSAAAGPARVTVPLPLPQFAEDVAPEFAAVTDADREGQLRLQDAVVRSLADIGRVFDTESHRVDDRLTTAEAAIGAAVTAARRLVQGQAVTARARIEHAASEQSTRVSSQIARKRGTVPTDVSQVVTETRDAADRQADAAQHHGDVAADELDNARPRYGLTARRAGDDGARRAVSYDEEPEIRTASVDAQRQAAHEVANQTAHEIDEATTRGARDLRSGGPQLHTSFGDQIRPILDNVRNQTTPLQNALSTAGDQIGTALNGGVDQSRRMLETSSHAVLDALAGIERQSRQHLRTAARTTKDGLRTAQASGEQELHAQAGQFVQDAHAELQQHLLEVSSRPVRRQLARMLATELRRLLRDGYGLGVGQSNRLAGQIASRLSQSLAQFHSEVDAAVAPATAGAERTGQSGAQQLGQLQRQVIAFLARTATTGLENTDTAHTHRLEQLGGMPDFVRERLQPGVDRTRDQVRDDKNRLMTDASDKLGTLDNRVASAMQKAQEKAELGSFGAWLLDQVRALGHAMLTPSFWVGLLVGLLVTIFIVATFGSGALVLVIAGAVAGALAAGASYLTQIYVDPLVDPSAPRRQFSASELGEQMLIGGIFGALGAGVGAGVTGGLGANVATATARTLAINRVAQIAVGAALGAVQNCMTDESGHVGWHWNSTNWDQGLLTNVVVSTAMSSRRVEQAIGHIQENARGAMVDRGHAFNVTADEVHASSQRMMARAERTSPPTPPPAAEVRAGTQDVTTAPTPAPVAERPVVERPVLEAPSVAAPPAERAPVPPAEHAPVPPVEHAPVPPVDEARPPAPAGAHSEQPPVAEPRPGAPGRREEPTSGRPPVREEPAVPSPHEPSTQLRAGDHPPTPAEAALQQKHGIPVRQQREFEAIAQRHEVLIDARPTNPEAPRLLAEGHLPKPEAIKAKSINELDLHLGFRREDIGLVGYSPREIPMDAGHNAPPEIRDRVIERAAQRRQERAQLAETMADLARPPEQRTMDHHGFEGQVTVDEHGVIRSAERNPHDPTGPARGFTGDNDIFMIRDARTNQQISGERYLRVIDDLQASGVNVLHGAHMNWDAPAESAHIFGNIVERHTPSPTTGQPNEPLIRYGRGQPEHAAADVMPPEQARRQAANAAADDRLAMAARARRQQADAAATAARERAGPQPSRPAGRRPPPLPDRAIPVIDLPEGTVMSGRRPMTEADARVMYDNARRDAPHHEVAVYRNRETGEHIVLQGNTGSVDPYASSNKAMAEFLQDRPNEARAWELVEHAHPVDPTRRVTPEHQRYPSARGGDFDVARVDSAARGGQPVEQRIAITTERGPEIVTYGYDPQHAQPYSLTHPGPDGHPVTTRFATLDEYASWFAQQPGVGQHSAHVDPHGPHTPGAGTHGEPAEPRPRAAGSDRPPPPPAETLATPSSHRGGPPDPSDPVHVEGLPSDHEQRPPTTSRDTMLPPPPAADEAARSLSELPATRPEPAGTPPVANDNGPSTIRVPRDVPAPVSDRATRPPGREAAPVTDMERVRQLDDVSRAPIGAEERAELTRALSEGRTTERTGHPGGLAFHPTDLVYGPSGGGRLTELAQQAGGRTLNDVATSGVFPNFYAKSRAALTWARQSGAAVHFDLTHMGNVEGVLAGTGPHAHSVTGWELRHIRELWNDPVAPFSRVVKFYENGREVGPPWEPRR